MSENGSENRAMFNPEVGDDIWVNSYQGPRCAKFQAIWPEKKKVLIEFHGSPEIVEADTCFVSASQCYFSAAGRKQKEAMQIMQQSGEYYARAAELQGATP